MSDSEKNDDIITKAASSNKPAHIPTSGEDLANIAPGLKQFASLTGGSILYCLSALAIICGIAELIGPALTDGKNLIEALKCVITLNVYELALFAVLMTIVIWAKVNDDSISVLILIGLFMIGTGVALGTVGYHNPNICAFIGIAMVLVALAKIIAMRKYISFKLSRITLLGLTIILLWNFIISAIISRAWLTGTMEPEAVRYQWQLGWMAVLAGVITIVVDIIKSPIELHARKENGVPFLKSSMMGWIFIAVIFACIYAHQYAVAYMFGVNHCLGDYLPLIFLFAIFLIEIIRVKDLLNEFRPVIVIVSMLPLFFLIIALSGKLIMAYPRFGIELLWNPWIITLCYSACLAFIAVKHRWKELAYVIWAYLIVTVLVFGYSPNHSGELNFAVAGAMFLLSLLAIGIFHKNIALCFISVVIASIASVHTNSFERWANSINLHPGAGMALIFGLGTLIIALFFGRKTKQILTIVGSIALVIAFEDHLTNPHNFINVLVLSIILAVLIWLRTRHILAILILMIPNVIEIYMHAKNLSHWRFVIIGFVLLFVGAGLSILKGKKAEKVTSKAEGTNSQ